MQDRAIATKCRDEVDFLGYHLADYLLRDGGAVNWEGKLLMDFFGGIAFQDDGDGRIGGVNVFGIFNERLRYSLTVVLFGEEDIPRCCWPLQA